MEGDDNRAKVTILSGAHRIKGYISLVPGARVTDYLVEAKNFIALTDAEIRDHEGRLILSAPFVNLSRESIQIVIPED